MKRLKAWLSSIKQPSVSAPYSQQPLPLGYNLELHQKLIPELKLEHQQLISLFTDTIKLAENQRFDKAMITLDEFRSLLMNHLINENTKLYLFLNAYYRHDEEFALITKLRNETSNITKAFMDFIQQWRLQGLNNNTRTRFVNQALPLSDALIIRLQNEEKDLFFLYEQAISAHVQNQHHSRVS